MSADSIAELYDSKADEYDEHYGESAYVIAMAWYFAGRSDGLRPSTGEDLLLARA